MHSGEVDATFIQPNEIVQFAADTVDRMQTKSFAVLSEQVVGISLVWDDAFSSSPILAAMPETCPPLPEWLSPSEHTQVYGHVRTLIQQGVPQLAADDVWEQSVLRFTLWIAWPFGAYPCCEGKPMLRVRLQFTHARFASAILAWDSTLLVQHSNWALRCSFSFDGRKWRRLDLPDSDHGGTGGRTMWGFRCDAMLKHIARSPPSSRSWGEGLGGDGFDDWDARTWVLWRILYFNQHMSFGSGAEQGCHGPACQPNVFLCV